jgi:hypothetical protein
MSTPGPRAWIIFGDVAGAERSAAERVAAAAAEHGLRTTVVAEMRPLEAGRGRAGRECRVWCGDSGALQSCDVFEEGAMGFRPRPRGGAETRRTVSVFELRGDPPDAGARKTAPG